MYTVIVCATKLGVEDITSNTFVKNVFNYYHYKKKALCIMIKDKTSNIMKVRLDIPTEMGRKLGVMEFQTPTFTGGLIPP